jgi:arabinose-5-phosphate isomerase
MNIDNIISTGIKTIQLQAKSISDLQVFINEDFKCTVELIVKSEGRLVVTGIGKSAIIAQKIVATLNSTGTPALFMHAADAIHGDLGMVQYQDIILIISKSGESPEIKVLVPFLKGFGNKLIGMGGNVNSFLAKNCNYYLNTTVEFEACPNNLAPTTSTTAQMVMGDALAICLMELKGFKSQDFARFHPGGNLGKKLYLKVSDLVSTLKPIAKTHSSIKEIIIQITKNRLGAVAIINDSQEVVGIVTDGDIRRMLEKYDDISTVKAADIMNPNPKQITSESLAVEAFELMRNNNINQLIVSDNHTFVGIIHIQDLIREGII